MNGKRFVVLVGCTFGMWAAYVVVSKFSGPRRVHATAAPVAYTVEMVSTSVSRSKVELERKISLFARRADGSSVVVSPDKNGQPSGVRKILIVPSRKVFAVDPFTKSIATYNYSDQELSLARNPAASCASMTLLSRAAEPQAKVFGYEVERYSGKLTGTEHPVSRWFAPHLNCFLLREEVDYADERYQYKAVRMPSSVRLGEPDPTLFEIPSDYTERSPSEILALARQQAGLAAYGGTEHAPRALDQVYRSRRESK